MNENPFTLMFGKEPYLTIRRDHIVSKVYSDFSSALPASQIYILIGARGAGKTVLLTEMYNTFEDEGWVVADVNPHRNILEDLAAQVYDKGKLKRLFLKGSFDISFHGVSFSLEGKEPVSSVSTVVERMLNHLKKKGKRLLITLDEVTSTDRIKEFAHDFQGFVRKRLPVFLVMTGLHENVMSLQNDKSLTFLYRAPKILLDPLYNRCTNQTKIKESAEFINTFLDSWSTMRGVMGLQKLQDQLRLFWKTITKCIFSHSYNYVSVVWKVV